MTRVGAVRPNIFLSFAPAARSLYYGDEALCALQQLGELRLNERDAPLDTAGLLAAAAGCQVIVSDRQAAAPAALFAGSPRLAVFLRCAMDIRNVDVDAASAAGVLVTHASAGFANAVAEWVLGAMLDLSRHFSDCVVAYRADTAPAVQMGRELQGATLGIIGYGLIGRRLGAVGLALGMQVLATDPLQPAEAGAVRRVGLDTLLVEADHVVCLAPARPQTARLMNAQRFAQMKPGAFFINASRGELVEEAALLRALDGGRLAGAALDVGSAPDQMPLPALARHPRVVATPHIGGLTPPAVAHQALETVAQLRTLLDGGMPVGAVNAAHATRLGALLAAT